MSKEDLNQTLVIDLILILLVPRRSQFLRLEPELVMSLLLFLIKVLEHFPLVAVRKLEEEEENRQVMAVADCGLEAEENELEAVVSEPEVVESELEAVASGLVVVVENGLVEAVNELVAVVVESRLV